MMSLSNLTIPGVGLAAIGSNAMNLLGQSNQLPPVLKNNSANPGSFASVLDAQQPNAEETSSTTKSNSEASGLTTKTEKQIREAARAFERTLVRQMLSTVRSNSLRGGDDQNESSKGYLEIADDKLADSLVAGKGIGFANKVADQMLKQPNVKALIETEKKSVSSTNGSNLKTNINSVVNQYKNVSSF
jgi:Rod binding domain-containing protein